MEDLITWLRAALAEREDTIHYCLDHGEQMFRPDHDLDDIDAKRRILAQYEDACERVRHPVSAASRSAARVAQFELENVVRLLALLYAGRDGYREEWRPPWRPRPMSTW